MVPPPRSAIEPADIRPLLPFLLLSELSASGAPFEIVYRLVGTQVVRWHNEDFTGRAHGAVRSLAESGMDDSYRQAAASRAPIFGRTALDAGDHAWIRFEYAVFPLSDDGKTVNKFLTIECIGGLEAADATSVGRDGADSLAAPAEEAEAGETGQHQGQRSR